MPFTSLRSVCQGHVSLRGDADFTELLHGNLWNRLIPERTPDAIVRVRDEEDVCAAVRFAREHGHQVVVRGGGHNWCQPTLRHRGILIDLRDLTGMVSLDVENRRAVIRPIISNREIQARLNEKGLAFPTGHCPQVKASGYFLGGGMAWNPTVWGCGNESLEAIDLVNAEGELIRASERENPDYFWAARGAGAGFFGVVVRYHLKLYSLPAAIHGSTYYFPLGDAPAIGRWLGALAPKLSPAVELSQFCVQAPAGLAGQAAADRGWLCMVTATAFEETPERAAAALAPLEEGPHPPLSSQSNVPYTFEELFDFSGALWPEGLRSRVEATFSNHSPGEMMEAVLPLIPQAPSPKSVFLFTIFCGPDALTPQKAMAFSMQAKVYGGPWTMWDEAADDDANSRWHHAMITALRPFNHGYYLSESDTVTRPATAVEAFAPANWQRLSELKAKYDPRQVFFSYFDGFAEDA